MDPYRGRGQMEPYRGNNVDPYRGSGRGSRRAAPSAFDDDPWGPMAMSPFGGAAGPGRRGDPFEMMDRMMGGMMGGGMFGRMDEMMADMRGGGGMQSGMMFSSGGGGGGSFQCQTMTFSSRTGADGQVHTEHFSSNTVGDRGRGIHETQQAYSDSSSGMEKMSLERQVGERGRKSVKERQRDGEERQTDMFRGMTEDDTDAFNQQWERDARPHLPQYSGLGQAAIGYGGRSHGMGASAISYGGHPHGGGYQQQHPHGGGYQQQASRQPYRRY